MKEKIKKAIILGTVLILIGVGIWWYQHQKAVNLCKERCYYGVKEVRIPFGRKPEILRETKIIEGWLYTERYFRQRIFPTREECIDYCLIAK